MAMEEADSVHHLDTMDILIIPPSVVVDCIWDRRTLEQWGLDTARMVVSEWGSSEAAVHHVMDQTVRCH
jgi:hypothetical protein